MVSEEWRGITRHDGRRMGYFDLQRRSCAKVRLYKRSPYYLANSIFYRLLIMKSDLFNSASSWADQECNCIGGKLSYVEGWGEAWSFVQEVKRFWGLVPFCSYSDSGGSIQRKEEGVPVRRRWWALSSISQQQSTKSSYGYDERGNENFLYWRRSGAVELEFIWIGTQHTENCSGLLIHFTIDSCLSRINTKQDEMIFRRATIGANGCP